MSQKTVLQIFAAEKALAGLIVGKFGSVVYFFSVAPAAHIFLPLRWFASAVEVDIRLCKWQKFKSFVFSNCINTAVAFVNVVCQKNVHKDAAFVAVFFE